MKNQKNKSEGFTLIELIISFTILVIIVTIAGLFFNNVLNLNALFGGGLETSSEVESASQIMATEIRSTAPSNIGSYAIDTASSSVLIFYSDIDEDGLFERIRYFVDGVILKKGVIKPTGNPLTYNPVNEVITEQIHNLVPAASSTFSYYDSNYTGSEPPMAPPINIAAVRIIGVRINAQEKKGAVASFNAFITPRNLRSNL